MYVNFGVLLPSLWQKLQQIRMYQTKDTTSFYKKFNKLILIPNNYVYMHSSVPEDGPEKVPCRYSYTSIALHQIQLDLNAYTTEALLCTQYSYKSNY